MKPIKLFALWMVLTITLETTAPVLAGSLNHCNVPSVMAGQATSLTCYFNHDLKQENTNLVVQHSNQQGQLSDILSCVWTTADRPSCNTIPGYNLDGSVSTNLTLRIPAATEKHVGSYLCLPVPSDISDATPCDFTLKEQISSPAPAVYLTPKTEQENVTTDNEQKGNNINVMAIIIPIVLILLLICAAGIIFLFWSRHVRKDKTENQSKRSGPICDDNDTVELHSLLSLATRHDASTEEETTMASGAPKKEISGTLCEYIYNRTRQFVEETGAVVITGPEQCGKSTLGRAMMNHFAGKGFNPLKLDHPNQWREKKQDGKKYVVLLDECPIERSSMKDLNSKRGDQSYVIFITRSGVSDGEIRKHFLPSFLRTAPVVTLSKRKALDEEASKKLLQACKEKDVEQVVTLLSDGVDPNCGEKTVTRAKQKTSDENVSTSLQFACKAGSVSVVNNLLMAGANVNAKDGKGFVPLHVACQFNHRDVTEVLLEAKSDVNGKDNNGLTPLHVACVQKAMDSAQVLLSANANFEAKTDSDWTPLHMACSAGSKEIVELLLDKGADINAVNKGGQTPLHVACSVRKKEIVELLLDKGADTNAVNMEGQTPLRVACSVGSKEIVELLDKCADTNAVNNENQTPFD